MALLTEPQQTQVWEQWLAAEMRANYFADLCGWYHRRQKIATWATLLLSSGAAAAFVTRLADVIPAWVAPTLALLAAGVSLYSLVAQNRCRPSDVPPRHRALLRMRHAPGGSLGAARRAVRLVCARLHSGDPRPGGARVNLALVAIELDTSIQCRAAIDTAVVNEYAERMQAGDTFPPIEAFGTKAKCWIGDGWHRVLAARQRGAETIAARLAAGGRVDALKHALGANALHGHRRSNADKRRSVEIALREFPKLSSRAVAKMCGVSDPFVNGLRPELQTVSSSTRTGQDGKERPASRRVVAEPQEPEAPEPVIERHRLGPPRDGMQFARMAVMDLEQIRDDDDERVAAFAHVREWIDARET